MLRVQVLNSSEGIHVQIPGKAGGVQMKTIASQRQSGVLGSLEDEVRITPCLFAQPLQKPVQALAHLVRSAAGEASLQVERPARLPLRSRPRVGLDVTTQKQGETAASEQDSLESERKL